MSWNGYPHYIRTKIIKQLQSRQNSQRKYDDQNNENLLAISCRVPYAGAQGDRLVKNLTGSSLNLSSYKNIYKTTKVSYYCNTKGRIPDYLKSHVVYEFCSPACNAGILVKQIEI